MTVSDEPLPIGIFARTFAGVTIDAVFSAATSSGISDMQFNLASAGLETVPDTVPDEIVEEILASSAHHNVSIRSLSGTCNISHPDSLIRREYVRRLGVLTATCATIRIPVLSLSTGTRDIDDLWRAHPDNQTREAHRDLRLSLRAALQLTADTGVTLAFEPEAANIIRTADQALDLLDELSDPRLAIVFDLANLVGHAPAEAHNEILHHAATRLRGRLALVHAKDIAPTHEVVPPGRGIIDFTQYLHTLVHVADYTGPVIMHGLAPADVPAALAHLRAARAAALAR